jgi:hypothetical protein
MNAEGVEQLKALSREEQDFWRARFSAATFATTAPETAHPVPLFAESPPAGSMV